MEDNNEDKMTGASQEVEQEMAAAEVATQAAAADLGEMFAQWASNPLVAIALAEPRLCRFIGDLLAGDDAESAARRNFPVKPLPMPAAVGERHGLDAGEAQRVSQAAEAVMAGDWSDAAVEVLLRATRHDDDVSDAEAAGYLRGRNEAIEARRRGNNHYNITPIA